MAEGEIEIKLTGLAKIRAELKQLKGELAEATDPKKMAELAAKAGELSDKLKDANEKVAVFAAGSSFEQTNNALGLMAGQLASLDFEGASESAKSFAVAAKGINGGFINTQLKSMGSIVGSLTSTFLSLGKALLTSPIFWIATAITALIVGIGALLNKLGFLKPILKAIGDAFRFIGQVIDGVVQVIKDFLDWMGLTAFKAEEAAARQQKALEKTAEAREKDLKKYVKGHDRKIELAKIEGKNTVEMEKEKQRAIAQTESARYKDLVAALEAAKKKGDVDAKELQDLKEKALQAKENASNARFELQKINKQEEVDNKKKNEEIQKQESDSYKKRIEQQKQFAEDRAAASRQIRDLEISLIENDFAKEIATLDEKYKRIREDVAKNEKLTSDERKRLLELYAQEEEDARFDLISKLNQPEQIEQTGILPPPEIIADEADGLVAILDEKFGAKELFADLKRNFKENFKESFDGTLEGANSMFQGLNALAQAFAGQSEASAKKAFNIQKAANIAQATMDTYKGAVGAFTQAVSTYPAPLGQIIGGVQAAAVVAMGIANIKKISSQQFGDKSGNVSASTGGGGTSTSAATPNVQMFGQNNNANNLSGAKSMESGGQEITVKAVVSETDVTNTQNKVKKITQAASL